MTIADLTAILATVLVVGVFCLCVYGYRQTRHDDKRGYFFLGIVVSVLAIAITVENLGTRSWGTQPPEATHDRLCEIAPAACNQTDIDQWVRDFLRDNHLQ